MSHILLVEPDRILAQTYKVALEKQKTLTVAVAHGAQMAIHLADLQTPDLILLEIQLPRHNGIEFLYELRSYPEWQSMPIILHTLVPLGHIEMSAEMIRTLGIVNHLYKPTTTLQQLYRNVTEALSAVVDWQSLNRAALEEAT